MKKGIILILLIILPFIAMADNQKMIALVEKVLDHQLKGMDIKQDLINLESQAEYMESETDALLLASWASLIRGSIYYDNDKKEAIKHLEKAARLAEKSNAGNESGLGCYLASMAVMQLCDLKGLAYATMNGMKLIYFTERGVSLEPDNLFCLYSQALVKANTPMILGGSQRTADTTFSQMTESDSPVMRYRGHLWLKLLAEKEKDKSTADFHNNQMNLIYPQTAGEGDAL